MTEFDLLIHSAKVYVLILVMALPLAYGAQLMKRKSKKILWSYFVGCAIGSAIVVLSVSRWV